MPRPPRIPSLRRHTNNLGVVRLNGDDHYLGPWPHPTKQPPPEVRAAYDDLIRLWLANDRRRLPRQRSVGRATTAAVVADSGPTVNALIVEFWERHVENHYRRLDGSPTGEVEEFRSSLRLLRELFGDLPAAQFGPLKFKAVRQRMVEAGWCRGVVNQRAARIRGMFKWAVGEELVPAAVYESLRTVAGLQRGRTAARETSPILPVDDATIDATLPFLRPQVQAMVQVQRLCGCRPGEVCALRGCDLDRSGPVWLYQPPQHKTSHRGKSRIICLGPQSQAVLTPWLRADPSEYLFQPKESAAARHKERSAARRTPMTPSQARRKRKANPKRKPSSCYSAHTPLAGCHPAGALRRR
jgi:integrase